MANHSTAALILAVIAIIIVIGILLIIIFTDTGRQEFESLIVWTIQDGGTGVNESITPTNNFLYINGSTVTSVTLNGTGNNKGDYFYLQNLSSKDLTANKGDGITFTNPTKSGTYVIRAGITQTFLWRTNTEIIRLR